MTKAKDIVIRDCNPDVVPWKRVDEFADHDLPRPIILLNGAFDILHSGHFKCLYHARKKGKTVIVALDSDAKIKNSKGPERPILTFVERAVALGYQPIDYIVEINSDEDFHRLITDLRPNYRVKGSEYMGQRSRIPHVPTLWVRKDGMRATKIVERIRKRYDLK